MSIAKNGIEEAEDINSIIWNVELPPLPDEEIRPFRNDATVSPMAEAQETPKDVEKISDNFSQCLQLYKKLLESLSSAQCYIVRRGLVDPQQLADQYGRLETWGEQVKVGLPDELPESLEVTLQSHKQLEDVLRSALQRLTDLLRKSIPQLCELFNLSLIVFSDSGGERGFARRR